MYFTRAAIFSLLVTTAISSTTAQTTKVDPRETIETAIPEAIRLLEAKEHSKFLKAFVSPADLKKFSERGGFEELETHFARSNAADLLEMLKAIKDDKPKLELEGKKATFEPKEPKAGKRAIVFLKVDKFWYLQN